MQSCDIGAGVAILPQIDLEFVVTNAKDGKQFGYVVADTVGGVVGLGKDAANGGQGAAQVVGIARERFAMLGAYEGRVVW